MPLLLQARITSVSFEEARYRHYRAQQRREGALQKAAAQVRQRAPSPFDEDAAQATRRLFARTVAQVVEIHALERTFDAWRSLEARPKAPPTLPARPVTNGAPDEAKYDPRALDLGARLAQRVLDDRISRSRLQQWSSINKAAGVARFIVAHRGFRGRGGRAAAAAAHRVARLARAV